MDTRYTGTNADQDVRAARLGFPVDWPPALRRALLKRAPAPLRRLRRRGPVLSEGLPPGLPSELIGDLAAAHTGKPVVATAYEQLSAWKRSGAYRVHVETIGGRWTCVYKDADYDPADLPALEGLPIQPGPPERLVHARPGRLAGWLPTVYHWEQVGSTRFRYVVEDLSSRARNARPVDLPVVVAALPGLHDALGRWVDDLSPSERAELLRYGEEFSKALRPYVERNVTRYIATRSEPVVERIWRSWPDVSQVHEAAAPTEMPLTAIHGDPNISNIHVLSGGRVVAVDWEWAGFGLAHADLASLTKRVTPVDEHGAVATFAQARTECSPAEHRRIYEWSQLERGLLDAGFLAAQLLHEGRRGSFNVRRYIRDALRRVRSAYRRLA